MKRITSFCIISLFIIQSCFAQDLPFIRQLLSQNNDRYSDYLSIKISSLDYKGFAVIEMSDLVYYFHKIRKLTPSDCLNKVRMVLTKKEVVAVDVKDLEEFRFSKVPNVPTVLSNAKNGKWKFMSTYFRSNNVLKVGISNKERIAIIHQLFQWEIATKIDCESGYLFIDN